MHSSYDQLIQEAQYSIRDAIISSIRSSLGANSSYDQLWTNRAYHHSILNILIPFRKGAHEALLVGTFLFEPLAGGADWFLAGAPGLLAATGITRLAGPFYALRHDARDGLLRGGRLADGGHL